MYFHDQVTYQHAKSMPNYYAKISYMTGFVKRGLIHAIINI